jgi:hypothetical protein
VNEFVFSVVKENTGSSACVRDTVFGLRFFLCLCGLEDLVLRLLSLRDDGKAGNFVRGRLSLTPLCGTGMKHYESWPYRDSLLLTCYYTFLFLLSQFCS